jgi:hypothetical protein
LLSHGARAEASISGCAGGLSSPNIAGLGYRDSETWIVGGRLINPPCGGFDCRDEGSGERLESRIDLRPRIRRFGGGGPLLAKARLRYDTYIMKRCRTDLKDSDDAQQKKSP